jgi:hypothetical protein
VSAVLCASPMVQSAKNALEPTALQKLTEFERYPIGWAYGGGISFERSVVNAARSLLAAGQSHGLYSADVFPGLEGELRVTFYSGDEYWEFTVLASGNIEYLHEQDHEPMDEREKLSLNDALQELQIQGQKQWNVSASSRPNISIVGSGDSKILVSSPRAQMALSPSSMRTAHRQIQDLSASTLKRITGT